MSAIRDGNNSYKRLTELILEEQQRIEGEQPKAEGEKQKPNAKQKKQESLNIPFNQNITQEQRKYITEKIGEFFRYEN